MTAPEVIPVVQEGESSTGGVEMTPVESRDATAGTAGSSCNSNTNGTSSPPVLSLNPPAPPPGDIDIDIDIESPSPRQKKSYFLQWSQLSKTVQVKDATNGLMRSSIAESDHGNGNSKNQQRSVPPKKVILSKVSGSAAPGKVLALIGPSGSGKTSLLNALSGRTSIQSGTISVNGRALLTATTNNDTGSKKGSSQEQLLMMKRFVSKVAYVQQEDIFFTHLTVRDQLAYTAFLRLPQAWPRAEKLAQVDETIRALRLTKVQDSPIKLLSGGEQKRVNIGTELLTNPSCLLLDEPTSGLDSTTAVALVKLLQRLASAEQTTVLMSIHQPSSGMFLSFDSLLLLAEGHVVYHGTPQESTHYLNDRGLACPEGYNAADHWMDLLVTDSSLEEEEEFAKSSHFLAQQRDSNHYHNSDSLRNRKSSAHLKREKLQVSRRTTRQQLIDAWDAKAVSEQMDASVAFQPDAAASDLSLPVNKYNTSWTTQYRVLVHRALKNSRSAIFTPLNMIKSALLGIITGMMWFQLPYTERTVRDRSAYFFFTMTYWVFDSMFGALLAFPTERKVIQKVRSTNRNCAFANWFFG
jgi:ABC-type multidrug transport system ATPase subunit